MLKPDAPGRCYVIKPCWSDSGRPRSPVVITLPATRGFGLDRDPREQPEQPPRTTDKPRHRSGRHWRK
jgi:hypothetical protein